MRELALYLGDRPLGKVRVESVDGWRTLAKEMDLRRAEIERMASCFRREEFL